MSEQTPTPSPEALAPEAPSIAAAPAPKASPAATVPPVFLGDEVALRAAAPELSRAIDARLASWGVIPATVASVDSDCAQLVLSDGRNGCMLRRDFGTTPPQVGQTLSLLAEASEGQKPGYSQDKADKLRLWAAASLACEQGLLVEGNVVAKSSSGLSVDIGVRAFLPTAQAGVPRGTDLEELIGQRLVCGISKFDRRTGAVELARRALLQKERAEHKRMLLAKLVEGAVLDGVVKNLTDYGAFIDLGGIDGLLHVSDMSWTRVKHPSELFAPGDEVRVQVLKFDAQTQKVSLGLKQLGPSPWTQIESQYPIGSVIRSTVRSVTDFGVFVALRPEIDGLVHISDLSWTQRVRHPGDLYKVGDEIEVVVLNIDLENERISLGVKQAQNDPWREVQEQHPVGSKFKAKASRITDFGVFVEVAPGIDGLIHISELREERVEHPGDVVQEGDELEVRVLDVDPDARKISLSLRSPVQPEDYRAYMNDTAGGRASLGEVVGEKLGKKKD